MKNLLKFLKKNPELTGGTIGAGAGGGAAALGGGDEEEIVLSALLGAAMGVAPGLGYRSAKDTEKYISGIPLQGEFSRKLDEIISNVTKRNKKGPIIAFGEQLMLPPAKF